MRGFSKNLTQTPGIDVDSVMVRRDEFTLRRDLTKIFLDEGYEKAFAHAEGDEALVAYLDVLKDKNVLDLKQLADELQQKSKSLDKWMHKEIVKETRRQSRILI